MAPWRTLVPAAILLCVLIGVYLQSGNGILDIIAVRKQNPFSDTETSLSHDSINSTTPPFLAEFVLVTAADTGHFRETRDSIASMQKNLPQHRILFYDLGLTSAEVQQVKSWCRVTLVKFDFSLYPEFVRELMTYSWKPLIIQEVLQQNPGAIWFDSSVRVKCPNLMFTLAGMLEKSGIALVDNTAHSIFATTDQRTYKYLTANITMLKQKEMIGASFIAVTNSTEIQKHIIEKLVSCSLKRDCIAPVGSTVYCNFKADTFREYANCHRYDQSVLNILLLGYFHGDVKAYWNKAAKHMCVSVERNPTFYFKLQTC